MSEDPLMDWFVAAECDLAVAALCLEVGHLPEGRVVEHRCVGRCQRCGAGIWTDGSEDE